MKHYTGFYYCTESNWDGGLFDVRNLVSVDKEDYENLVNETRIRDNILIFSSKIYRELKPEVFDWLETNVKNQKNGVKGWCCGDKEYGSDSYSKEFSLFFYRRKDAILFIKTWSIFKKPTETYNQNTYVNKVLDLKTNTLKVVKKINETEEATI